MALKPLRKGIDYDLVNISLIGHDPVTGRSFEECMTEWEAERDDLIARVDRMRWWHLREQVRVRYAVWVLRQREGMHGISFQ